MFTFGLLCFDFGLAFLVSLRLIKLPVRQKLLDLIQHEKELLGQFAFVDGVQLIDLLMKLAPEVVQFLSSALQVGLGLRLYSANLPLPQFNLFLIREWSLAKFVDLSPGVGAQVGDIKHGSDTN
jgi:hypothetical protein